MPELSAKRSTKKIVLWTTPDEAWVEIYEDLMTQDVMDLSKLQDDSNVNFEVIRRIIADWNFTDKGEKAPITLENIGRIPMKYWFKVAQEATAFKELQGMAEKLTTEQKKS